MLVYDHHLCPLCSFVVHFIGQNEFSTNACTCGAGSCWSNGGEEETIETQKCIYPQINRAQAMYIRRCTRSARGISGGEEETIEIDKDIS